MKIAKLLNNKYAIRLEKGEEIITSLEDFAKQYSFEIGFAQFNMIGAVEGIDEDKIKIYLSKKGDYELKEFVGKMELLPSWGNITWDYDKPDEPIVHCHVSLGEESKLSGFGGHLGKAKVSLTAEIILEVLSHEKFTRKMDQEVELKLWNFPLNYLEQQKELEKEKEENIQLKVRLKILHNNYDDVQKALKSSHFANQNNNSTYLDNRKEIDQLLLSPELKDKVLLVGDNEKQRVIDEWKNYEFTILPYQLEDKNWVVLLLVPSENEDDEVFVYTSLNNEQKVKTKVYEELKDKYLTEISLDLFTDDTQNFKYRDAFASIKDGGDASFVYKEIIIKKLLTTIKDKEVVFKEKKNRILKERYDNWDQNGHRLRINKDDAEEMKFFNTLLDSYKTPSSVPVSPAEQSELQALQLQKAAKGVKLIEKLKGKLEEGKSEGWVGEDEYEAIEKEYKELVEIPTNTKQ